MTFRQFNKINDILSHHDDIEILLQEHDGYDCVEVGRFDSESDVLEVLRTVRKHPNAEIVTFDGDFTKEINWE